MVLNRDIYCICIYVNSSRVPLLLIVFVDRSVFRVPVEFSFCYYFLFRNQGKIGFTVNFLHEVNASAGFDLSIISLHKLGPCACLHEWC